jgi:hypothetical protein
MAGVVKLTEHQRRTLAWTGSLCITTDLKVLHADLNKDSVVLGWSLELSPFSHLIYYDEPR